MRRKKRGPKDAQALAAAGLDCLQCEDFPGAVRHFTAAREHATARSQEWLERTTWLAAEAAARLEAGAFGADDAERVTTALSYLAADDAVSRVLAARLRSALGRHHGVERRVINARFELQKALDLLDGNDDALLRARTESLLGAMLAADGSVESGLEYFLAARARLDAPPLQGHVRDRARVTMNAAIALATIGRASEAADTMAAAMPLFEALDATGRRDALPELARARRNLGFMLGRSGRHAASVDVLHTACADYERALRRRVTAGERAQWTASLASTRNSLGYSLAMIGRLDDADRVLRRSARAFATLVRTDAGKRDELARVWVNLGHVAMHRRDYAAAARLYRKGSVALDALVKGGQRSDCEYDTLNAQLGEAHAALGRGQAARAAARIEPALARLAQTTEEGRLQNALPWFDAWQRHLQAGLDAAATGADVRAALAALERALATPPVRPASNGPEPAHALREAATALAAWRAAAPDDAAWRSLLRACREYLFGWSTTLLSESDPEWLRRHAGDVAATVRALGEVAAADPDDADALAGWFLATRGLRAQRTVLAEPAGDPRLRDLHEQLQQLQALEAEMLGEPRVVHKPSSHEQQRSIQWRALRMYALTLRRGLEDQGVLPRVLRLRPPQVRAALPPRAALVLLARVGRDRVRAMALTAAGALAHVAALDDELAAFPCTALHALARAGMRAAASGQPVRLAPDPAADDDRHDDGDAYALQLFTRLWQQALQPLLESLRATGIDRVALVPSDDLHLVPWNALADRHLPSDTRLHLYASAGAWWRVAHATPAAPSSPRWTLLSDAADTGPLPALPWLDVERRLSLALWRDAMCEPPPSDEALATESDALLAMGHGLAPEGNTARGGLFFGGRVLRAGDLATLRGCRRALLSACLLGRTDDVHGEGLGFLAASMDRQLDFATGWLTEVPDFAACLFSLATQWCLRAAPADADWSDVLRALRVDIAADRWPAQFGAWLAGWAQHAPALAAVSAAPPMVLKRVLPWAVTLGR